jgi:DNA polymerase III subunit gamma/tau
MNVSSFILHPSSFAMSLYRKYRPQTFDDLVGQEHIAGTLRNAVASDRVAHAYLFCGPRGTGKTTSARLLAKCLNCAQGPTSTPCNQCDFCVRVRDNQPTMDLIEIDAASNTGVDNVREVIIDKVNVAPAQGRYRIYIIDEVHMLSTSSFNALLKTLEEPPAHAIFVLATTDAHKVPPTITSRCQRFDFRRVGPSDIVKRLQYVAEKEAIQLHEEAARLIAFTADGALRDALTLLEQVTAFSAEEISEADVRLVLGTVSRELLWQLMDAVANKDANAALQSIERATEEGVSFSQLTRDLVAYNRDLLLLTVGFESESGLSDDEKRLRQTHSKLMGRARLTEFVEALRAAEKEMRQSTDHRLLLELVLVRHCAATERVAATERMVERVVERAAPRVAEPPRPVWEQEAAPQPDVSTHIAAPRAEKPVETADEASAVVPDETSTDAPVAPMDLAPPAASETEAVETVPVEVAPATAPAAPRKKGRRIHNLDEFHELWPAVLSRVKKKIGVSAVAYLHDAQPVALTEKEAILEFQKEFHFEKAKEAATRLPFEKVLNECFATPHILRFQLAQPKAKPAPPLEKPDESHEDDDDEDDIFRMAQDMFAAQVVGRSGQQ